MAPLSIAPRVRTGLVPQPMRRVAVVLVATVALAALAAGSTGPAEALPRSPGSAPAAAVQVPPPSPAPAPGPAPLLAPGLDRVAVTSPTYDRAAFHRDQVAADLDEATRVELESGTQLFVLAQRDQALGLEVLDLRARERASVRRLAELRSQVRTLAVQNYIRGTAGAEDSLELTLDAQRHNELGTQQLMFSIVNDDKIQRLVRTRNTLDKVRTEIVLTVAVRDGVRATIRQTTDRRAQAGADRVRLSGDLVAAQVAVEDNRRQATVVGGDFSLVVLDAYVKAAAQMAAEAPGCGIPWWAMAGIGRTESHHGTYGGAQVRRDGSLTKPILGIALDGSNATAVVPGASGGFDRAQGPMQFISSTWARWQRDGNGDGVNDIQNFYDAAAGAAAYLCASGPMNSDEGLRRGYFSYNHSQAYVDIVLARAHGYEQAVKLPPPG